MTTSDTPFQAILIVFIALSLFIWCALDQDKWNHFKETHRCVVIGHRDGQGRGDQTGYKCDDGMEYWR